MELLEEHRRVVRPFFPKHNGREVKTIGDAFLVEFASALEAVRCAFDIQQSMHEIESVRPPENKVRLRIGIHVGDVIHSQNDVYGDAVNVASRIQSVAQPEGICVSQQVYDQVKNKFEFPLVSVGKKELKNVVEAVEVYKVVTPWEDEKSAKAAQFDRKRIAVLPFANISSDPTDEFFADGMTEELINTISHNQQLKVIARTSVGRFKGSPKSISEIAKEIGVGSILEGSVRKAGNKIRVTAQLIDAATEEHVWSDNYDRQIDDIFVVQSEIAGNVSEALKVRLAPEELKTLEKKATSNPMAHLHYLRGRSSQRERSESALTDARDFFRAAIAEDATYAEAYAGLAESLYLLGSYGFMPIEEARQRGRAALEKALSLDEDLAEAHNAMAIYLESDYMYQAAEKEFRKALSLNKNYALAHHWYCILLMEMGRFEEGLKEILQAEDVDPLSGTIAFNSAIALSYVGDDIGVDARIKKLKELDANEFYAEEALAWIDGMKGRFADAARHAERVVELSHRRPQYLAPLGMYHGLAGNRDKALKVIEELMSGRENHFGKSFDIATVYLGLGERDETFRWLDTAYKEQSLQFRLLRYYPIAQEIRKDPRYIELFQRAGLSL